MRVLTWFMGAVCLVLLSASAGSPRADTVSVRDFGAVGDGTSDDVGAFRAALDAVPVYGGTVYVPSGDYLLSDELRIHRGNLDIVCGNNARLIVGSVGQKIVWFDGSRARGGRMQNVRVAGCKFWDPDPVGNVALEESHGVVLSHVDDAILERLDFDSMGDESIDVILSSNVRILNNRVRNGNAATTAAYAGSISVNSSSRIQIRGNVIEDQANGSAIRVEVHGNGTHADYVAITDNQIFDMHDRRELGFTSGSGINVIPAANRTTTLSITGNQIVNPYRYGIVVKPILGAVATAVVVQGNIVSGGGHGIEARPFPNHAAIIVAGGTSVAVVSANVIQGWGSDAVRHSGLRIVGNRIGVVGNVVGDVSGETIRETRLGGASNLVSANLGSADTQAKAEAGALPRSCRLEAIESDGRVDCAD